MSAAISSGSTSADSLESSASAVHATTPAARIRESCARAPRASASAASVRSDANASVRPAIHATDSLIAGAEAYAAPAAIATPRGAPRASASRASNALAAAWAKTFTAWNAHGCQPESTPSTR